MKPRLALTIALLLVLSGCGNLFDTAAAVVGGTKITVQEVSEGLDKFKATEEYQRLAAQGDSQAIERQFQQAYLTQLVRRAVLEPRAEELGVEVTDEEVAERIDEIKNDFGSDSGFEEALKEQGLDLEQLELLVRDNILEDKLREEVTADIGATDEEVETYYELNIADYTRTRSSHILVEDLETARSLARQLQQAPKKQLPDLFEQLARQHSTDKGSAKNGGDLGFTSAGELVEPYENTAADLEIGEVSDPVQSQFGYHIIRVTDREVTPLSDASIPIAEQLSEGEKETVWQKWLKDAYKEADIRVNSRFGELDPDTQQIVDATAEDLPGAVEPSPTPSLSIPGG